MYRVMDLTAGQSCDRGDLRPEAGLGWRGASRRRAAQGPQGGRPLRSGAIRGTRIASSAPGQRPEETCPPAAGPAARGTGGIVVEPEKSSSQWPGVRSL